MVSGVRLSRPGEDSSRLIRYGAGEFGVWVFDLAVPCCPAAFVSDCVWVATCCMVVCWFRL